ncbi:cytochrome P450 [Wilcoxina mikolae CBS 423.85]|nr:cytochrome P450 [Wilcoxina mikolae CBS 423.85]
MALSPVILAVAAVAATYLLHHLLSKRLPSGTTTPPGPSAIPLLGNLLQVPKAHSWLQFKTWADSYGPIFQLNMAGKNHIVLSTEKTANELLRERGTLYSSREHMYFASDLLSHNLRPLLLPHNDVWRRGRKLMHTLAMPKMAASYEPAQSLESKKFLYDFFNSPADYQRHLERYSSGLIFRIGFGKTVATGHEAYVRRILGVAHTLERAASPGAYLCDSLPILQWLPEFLAPFKKEGRRCHEEEISLFRELQDDVREEMENGNAPECFTRHFLERQEEYGLSDDEGAYVIGTMFEAGSGTTASAMMSLLQCMVRYPEWQKQGQEEVDTVCGDKLPQFDDIPSLPRVRAIVKEVLRYRPVTAGGVPHKLIKDDTYAGYFFPAGTIVHANQWAIHRDTSLYPDPESFNPNRWLDPEWPTYKPNQSINPNLQNYSAFGFGRRICPGLNIAERSLYILTARVLWACDLRKKVDPETGKEVAVPEYAYTEGFNVQPLPFDFKLVERKGRRKVCEDVWEKAKEEWGRVG